jgi:hypothetical protein
VDQFLATEHPSDVPLMHAPKKPLSIKWWIV